MTPLAGARYAHVVAPPVAPVFPTVAGLYAHFDAGDGATVTYTGGLASQIADTSGNGHHLVQAVGTSQPAYGTRTQNGLATLDLDGTADHMTSNVATLAQPLTFFAVVNTDNATAGIILASHPGDGVYGSIGIHGGPWGMYAGAWIDSSVSAVAGTAVQLTCVLNGASSYIRANGIQTNGNPATLGWGGDIGDLAGSQFFDGRICELAVYNTGSMAGADRDALETYLRARWGTP